ncbi:MAG: IscS subfamily cysteine desulfurase [Actinobacteria bacterium]|nr:IscS subfamily cysteine desulfurase [Actinomycetota bacterium]MCL5883386.1 IscS subfamily cysteine desulfurase [Actinomycetota bacterium]
MDRAIFLDNAATTRTDPEVLEAMGEWLGDNFGSPATLYAFGSQAKQAIEAARQHVADLIGSDQKDVYFTSGATEANNWAIKGVAEALEEKGKHIITNQAEHHSILMPCGYLEKKGWDVTYLPVDGDGLVDPADVEKAIREDTVLVTMVHANHEIGTIQPIAEIGAITREKGVYLHVNAAQSVGHVPVDVAAMSCDLLSISGHKFYGPKGVGALYVKRGVRIVPLLHGGGQEKKRRAGTHNVPGIVGLGKASELARKNLASEAERLTTLRDYIIGKIESNMEDIRLNGHRTKRLPNNVNVSIEGIEGESIMLSLSYPTAENARPVFVSTGSACVSGTLEPSHILLALGLPAELAHGSVRISLSRHDTREDADYALDSLFAVSERLRSMSPVYKRGSKQCASGSGEGCDCEAAS